MLQAYSVKLPGDTLSPFVLLAYADNFPAVEFQSIVLTSSIAPEEEVSPRSCATKERKCTKKRDIRAKFFFVLLTYYFFLLSHLSETRSFISLLEHFVKQK